LQRLQNRDASFAETLTGVQTDFDFRLIEPLPCVAVQDSIQLVKDGRLSGA